MAKRGDDVLCNAVTEEILSGVTRQVLEGQYRQRWALGEASRRGEACDLDRLGRSTEPRAVPSPRRS